MVTKKALLLFECLQRFHLEKDVGMIPAYLHEKECIDFRIACLDKDNTLPVFFRGVHIDRFRELELPFKWNRLVEKLRKIPLILNLLLSARSTDILMQFHLTSRSAFYASWYRRLNPKGLVYLKLDLDTDGLEKIQTLPEGKEKNTIRGLLRDCNLISAETQKIWERLQPGLLGVDLGEKLIYLPNGYDCDGIQELIPTMRRPPEKEKMAILIGNIGASYKDHSLLLDALQDLDMRGWKIVAIGKIEDAFRGRIESFYRKNPGMRGKLVFTGPIHDRRLLYDYYNRAQVYLFTSRMESSGLVLTEAMAFGNFIVATDTGAALDVTENGKWGKIIPVGDVQSMKNTLEDIFSGAIDTGSVYEGLMERARNHFRWSVLTGYLYREMESRFSSNGIHGHSTLYPSIDSRNGSPGIRYPG